MRLPCPSCGERDRREFTYHGVALDRPEGGEWSGAWHDYLHLRDNPAGPTRDLWCHDPCGTVAIITRDTVSHAVIDVALPGEGAA